MVESWSLLAAAFDRAEEAALPPGVAPYRRFSVPDEWRADAEREAEFWRLSRAESHALAFELEMAMMRTVFAALLIQNKYVDRETAQFRSWPSRDRHQLWSTAWVALRFVYGRSYTQAEVDSVLRHHLGDGSESLLFAVRAEVLRRGFLVPAGSGSNNALGDGALTLSRDQVLFLLDGDKLFLVRTAVAGQRPWWALPLAAQLVAAPRTPWGTGAPPAAARRFRCVLLGPRFSDAALASVSAVFVPAGGGPPVAPSFPAFLSLN